jgi:putative hydroxymethylpyrimidine transporter CytX
VYVITSVDFGTFLHAHSDGSLPFWQGVDLVVAMPISWIPLAADYTRFTRTPRAGLVGTAIGYGVAQAWFYVLGVLLILSNVAKDPGNPTGFVAAVLAVPAGLVALAILAVDETDEAFANIYSASVSVQNAAPRLGQRPLSIAIGAVCTALAVAVPLVQYENFLLLIGAVFVPLFGVLAAHHAIVRRGYTDADVYGAPGGVRVWGVAAWLAGFVVYNWLNPGTVSWWVSATTWLLHDTLRLPFPLSGSLPWLGASVAAFVVAFGVQGAEALVRRSPR